MSDNLNIEIMVSRFITHAYQVQNRQRFFKKYNKITILNDFFTNFYQI